MNIKIERHDRSLNENEKIEFRKSETWRNWRETVAESQDRRDFVTGEPLKDNWNCHHLCLKSNEYTILEPNRFVAVNEKTHKQIHEYYKLGWRKNVSNDNPYYKVLDIMDKFNDDTEIVLFENRIEYRLINSQDKDLNTRLARTYKLPIKTDSNMIIWRRWNLDNYGYRLYPQDTKEWIYYLCKINNKKNKDFLRLILELRHAGLYSSYKNFRNNPTASRTAKNECRIELENTTKFIKMLDE